MDKSELELKLRLRDSRAIKIVESIPDEKRNEVLEKYIILGDMLVTFSKIETSEKALEDFLRPLGSKIETLTDLVQKMYPVSVQKKGELTVREIFESLEGHFNPADDIFENISEARDKFTDIMATVAKTSTRVLIEVKEYSTGVPSDQVEKFWRDMDLRNARYGIFVSMRARIHNIPSPVYLETRLGRTAIFVVNCDLNWKGHLLAYYLIKKLVETEGARRAELRGEEFHLAASRVIKSLKDIQHEVDVIDKLVGIADNLKGRSIRDLQDMIDLANKHKKNLGERIDEMLRELGKANKISNQETTTSLPPSSKLPSLS